MSSQQQPMDIDPVDGGPKATPPPPPPGGNAKHNNTNSVVPMQISEEEEARQAIDMFRGDDMSARVAAANRLEAVASVLGEQRTREVCVCASVSVCLWQFFCFSPCKMSWSKHAARKWHFLVLFRLAFVAIVLDESFVLILS